MATHPGVKCSQEFEDRIAMLHTFCKNPSRKDRCGDRDEFEIKKKEWQNVTLDLRNLTYGESCTYNIKSKCGFPKIEVNSSNVDLIVSYKKSHWDRNDTF